MDTDVVVKEYFDVPSGKIKDYSGKEWPCNRLKCQCEYRAGGYNYGTGEVVKRGYYMSVQPVDADIREGKVVCESYGGFSGFYDILFGCGRKGSKMSRIAADLFKKSLVEKVNQYYLGNDVVFTSEYKSPDWDFVKNDGGASLRYKGINVAHVPNIFDSEAASKGLPLNGMKRAMWLCEQLNRKGGAQ